MSFGAACGFGAPALRIFSSVTWQPPFSREQQRIERILDNESPDPDGDGLIGGADRCPDERGPVRNSGCPDKDADRDGVVDRMDECPTLRGLAAKGGCPPAFINSKGDQIVIMDKVHFATDQDTILEKSKPILDEVAELLVAHPEIVEVRIEGHTDIRAGDAHNLELSQRRVDRVRVYLIEQGIASRRLQAEGFGHERPLVDDARCDRPDDELDRACLQLTGKNRRVEFHIVRRARDRRAE
jgi:outer membrane protein OmpA-like peptidoglycan-associated protein